MANLTKSLPFAIVLKTYQRGNLKLLRHRKHPLRFTWIFPVFSIITRRTVVKHRRFGTKDTTLKDGTDRLRFFRSICSLPQILWVSIKIQYLNDKTKQQIRSKFHVFRIL
jgi:hypothetical protein